MRGSRNLRNGSVGIWNRSARKRKIHRNFDLLLPKFHFILPNFYFPAPWRIFVPQRAIGDFLRGD